MKVFKKIASSLIALVLLFSLSSNAFAKGEQTFEKITVTDEELDRAIEQALQMKLATIADEEERKDMELALRGNLATIEMPDLSDENVIMPLFDLSDIWTPNLPDIHLQNKYVKASIDVILDAILISLGVGTITVALKKYGAKELGRMFTSSIKTKILGKAAIALGISLPVLADFVVSVLDPAEKITNYLDSLDKKPKNGYFDVIW
ncbi:hypothetical protein [Lysinibacillus piscis]|uniref:Uncharacterized protein n=1 Tax=Lysinibacillus piscis TaxID=2518931 RepID=A0ABQ5NN09_9BACI|nr:hypothetical protein [Lysinibacillus sp. KH24]GLC89684.1 hypothetical protein LYSBPC_28110 [Lysinibacillus sp. KH24]